MDTKGLAEAAKDLRSTCCLAEVKVVKGRWVCQKRPRDKNRMAGCGQPCHVEWRPGSKNKGTLPPLPIVDKEENPLEETGVKAMLKWLNSLPECYAHKTHGGLYGRAGKPDITGCYKGLRFEIEAKRPKGGVVSKAQEKELARWAAAGCHVAVARSLEELQAFWKAWGWL